MDIKTITFEINKNKPDRSLTQWDIAELGTILGETPAFPYLVRMRPGGQPAGNHYHKEKRELFVCVEGELEITLEDIRSKEKKNLVLRADAGAPAPSKTAAIILPGIAHAVKNIGNTTASLLVFATRKAREPHDDFAYAVI